MRQTSATLIEFIKWALRANYDDVTKEPLPQRWLNLINDLDQRERAGSCHVAGNKQSAKARPSCG